MRRFGHLGLHAASVRGPVRRRDQLGDRLPPNRLADVPLAAADRLDERQAGQPEPVGHEGRHHPARQSPDQSDGAHPARLGEDRHGLLGVRESG